MLSKVSADEAGYLCISFKTYRQRLGASPDLTGAPYLDPTAADTLTCPALEK